MEENVITETKTSLNDVISVVYFNAENAVFDVKNNFLTLDAKLKNEQGETEDKKFPRVYLHRAFPFDNPFSYISVLDKDNKEIGIIRELKDLDENSQNLIVDELHRKYYAPSIKTIQSVKERYGYSYWKVTSDAGDLSFTLQDTFRSILKVGNNRVFIVDIDNNRYEIPDVEALDFKSYKKIELYL
ncbi:MAG: DUF1854 domain-containing protein [Oscillospiraceae bacterium]|nr:DUF1854 domain-containing protein [Oscillospiraceae bacterium]